VQQPSLTGGNKRPRGKQKGNDRTARPAYKKWLTMMAARPRPPANSACYNDERLQSHIGIKLDTNPDIS